MSKTEYVQTGFRCENDPSCHYGVRYPTLIHTLHTDDEAQTQNTNVHNSPGGILLLQLRR